MSDVFTIRLHPCLYLMKKTSLIFKLSDTFATTNSVLLNVILFETFDMKTGVTFLTPRHCFCMAMCTAILLLLRNNHVLETVKTYVLQSLLRLPPHALVVGIPYWVKNFLAIYLRNCNKSIGVTSLSVHILCNCQALFTAKSSIYKIKHQYHFFSRIATSYFLIF